MFANTVKSHKEYITPNNACHQYMFFVHKKVAMRRFFYAHETCVL